MTTITHNDDGSVTATDPATGIETKCGADEASEGRREAIARDRLGDALRKYSRRHDDAAVRKEMG